MWLKVLDGSSSFTGNAQTMRMIVLPGVAKFGSMDCKDTIEIRVFFQCQNPDKVFCVFVMERGKYLFNIFTVYTLTIIGGGDDYGEINSV